MFKSFVTTNSCMLPERYVPKKISKVSKSDRMVSLTGVVIEVDNEKRSFIIDDNTGKIEVFFGKDSDGKIVNGTTVQAFCILTGDNLVLDVLEDMAGVDLNLLKTVDDLYSRAD